MEISALTGIFLQAIYVVRKIRRVKVFWLAAL
jgi:hypothetical protein